jgi:CDP-diglyceride synthetase
MASTLLRPEDFLRIWHLAFPLVFGGIVHMIVVKMDILSYLKKPIHHRWFGANKTWRGFLVMPLATWPGVVMVQHWERIGESAAPVFSSYPAWVLALGLGLAYCLAELPNSFLKRRLGIKEGQTSDRAKWFFVILDQADSVMGCLLIYYFVLNVEGKLILGTLVLGTLIHLFFNVLLYLLKLRKNPL